MGDTLLAVAEHLLEMSAKHGATDADVRVAHANSVSIDVLEGELEHAESSEQVSAGLRVFVGKRQACVSGSDLRRSALAEMAKRAVSMAQTAPEDPYAGLASPEALAKHADSSKLELFDSSPRPTPSELERQARRIEAAALAVPGVSKVETATCGEGSGEVQVLASNGFAATYRRNRRAAGCSAIAGEGLSMETDYYGESRVFLDDMSSPEEIGAKAGERAVERYGALRPPTGSFPVIFHERVAGSLIGHLVSAINGASIVRGSSWLLDAMDTQVLPDSLSLEEQPWRPRSASSWMFDHEGLPTRPKFLVRNGCLRSWLLDLSSARQLGLASTGNGARGLSSPPQPRVSNLHLTEGESSLEQLASEMGRGLVVSSLIGATINPTTGDYSRGASGYWVEGGERRHPVSEFTIAGNLKEMLRTLIPANDSRPFKRFRVPSLLVEGLTVAGE
ncbi:MAG: TldD/PmbA family protein [Rhodobacteraceae bacterium]|nr:TldD/PmbA family protein [Paracoccaceae bacterium]